MGSCVQAILYSVRLHRVRSSSKRHTSQSTYVAHKSKVMQTCVKYCPQAIVTANTPQCVVTE